jgi:activating signal cointegrator complex subunit 1
MPPKTAPKRLTHFLCLPLVTSTSRPQLAKSLHAFRSDIKDDRSPENSQGIPEKAVRPVGTIHLTLGVMSLLTQERVEGALAVLRSLDIPSLLSTPPTEVSKVDGKDTGLSKDVGLKLPKVTLRGLISMHPPAKTSILYSSPEDADGRLYAFCTKLRDALAEFMVPDTRPLLLHATLLNTVYVPVVRSRSGGPGAGHGRNKAKMTIDAREILERYSEISWMDDIRVEKVAICRMGARSVRDEDGNEIEDQEYVVEGEVDMP